MYKTPYSLKANELRDLVRLPSADHEMNTAEVKRQTKEALYVYFELCDTHTLLWATHPRSLSAPSSLDLTAQSHAHLSHLQTYLELSALLLQHNLLHAGQPWTHPLQLAAQLVSHDLEHNLELGLQRLKEAMHLARQSTSRLQKKAERMSKDAATREECECLCVNELYSEGKGSTDALRSITRCSSECQTAWHRPIAHRGVVCAAPDCLRLILNHMS